MTADDTGTAPPSRIPWPPLLLVGAIGGGALVDSLLPGPTSWPDWARTLGVLLIVLAFSIDVWCVRLMWRRGTTVRPDRAVSSLVTNGPFRFSRNPIYVGNVALVAGLGLVLAAPAILLLAPVMAVALKRLAIEPEERHLARRFGRDYEAYVARTRRWL
ncbi:MULTISPECIES: methyltransferase family protein [Methylosinus]|uniref:Isoprenylcysteine carboxylmethyltransferase family protein n=1 Tax=Methylosinus trichosporium (strain ATCC 35070 / NCIMB 11131 / UNIQEM 75 / OB3b) TaxID=595536 RepID=A0A2D2CX75_METT3|nr:MULTISPECIES: isoprenylcysteine carboxylmethyltransferase family protein [Methylosinus]ATQ67313.1 isoprenylcysteine carboxylmethyltransferase family protein [Methylosinus trichosporium OB3b]OBS52064.1 isoprenylcysteine carboxyl methyltransferase [Methylosinus sp. 3S-1]